MTWIFSSCLFFVSLVANANTSALSSGIRTTLVKHVIGIYVFLSGPYRWNEQFAFPVVFDLPLEACWTHFPMSLLLCSPHHPPYLDTPDEKQNVKLSYKDFFPNTHSFKMWKNNAANCQPNVSRCKCMVRYMRVGKTKQNKTYFGWMCPQNIFLDGLW